MSNRDFDRNEFFVLVSGFDKDTDRSDFKNQFEKFGLIRKIFIENTGKYAKIYFANKGSCTAALQSLEYNPFNWKVEFFPDREQMKLLEYNRSRESEVMDDEGDFTEKSGYCTVHGQPLMVLQADSGDLYVKLKDIRRAGFTVFRKDTFSDLLVDKDQINKEFELHLLSEAKNYILKNKAATIDEDQILRTIERCKSKLVGEKSPNSSVLTPGRSIVPTCDNNFRITTELGNSNGGRNSNTNTSNFVQRPPKTMSSNFMAANRHTQDNQHARNQPKDTQSIGNHSSGWQSSMNRASSSQSFNKENRQMNGLKEDLVSAPKSTGRISNANSTCASDDSNYTQKSKVNPNNEVENISSMSLNPGNCYKVNVCFIESEKICWVQEKNSSLDSMTLELFEDESSLEVLENPKMGQLVIAFYEELWYRARVINEQPLCVHYFDYGNKNKPELVKLLPEKYKKIPAMACRMVINLDNGILSDGLEINVRISKQYEDGTYLGKVLEKIVPDQSHSPPDTKRSQPCEEPIEKVSSPQTPKLVVVDNKPVAEKLYFDIPSPVAELRDGQMVMINGLLDDKLLVKTKDCCKRSKELIDYIKKLDKSTLTMASVKKNQLVLCSKDGMVGLYRATVIEKDNEMFVTVKYIDYPGEDQLSIKSLRNVDEHLAKQPALLIETPICKGLVDAVPAALDFVSQLIEDKTKMIVVLSSNVFDLELENGNLLSEELNNIRKPKRVMAEPQKLKPVVPKEEDKLVTSKTADVETKSNELTQKIENIVPECEPNCLKQQKEEIEHRRPKKQDEPTTVTKKEVYVPINFDDMDWIKAEVGKNDYICYTINDLSDVTLISLEEDSISYMENISMIDLTDNTPFEPVEMEMCMVSYKAPEEDTACWYRAVVLSVDGEEFTLLCVDFGNQITVKKDSIRKFSEDMKCMPILGISCACIGIPHNDKVLDSLKKHIQEGTQVKVDIKEYSEAELKYKIEFPEIYELLRKDRLCN